MINDQNGWGLTDRYILRSSDGGKTWINVTPGDNFPANSILQGFFLNTNEGWVVLPNNDFKTGVLYQTSDGGNSWESNQVPFGGVQLFFLDSKHGWAMADRGSAAGSQAVDIYSTNDGGVSWMTEYEMIPGQPETPGKLPYSGSKIGFTFRDLSTGWITGTIPSPNDAWLFISQDGGTTWNKQNLVLPDGYQGSTLSIEAPHFFTPLQGLLPVRLYQVSPAVGIFSTNDGGLSWNSSTPAPINGPLDCISFVSCRIWNGITLAFTDNGGQNWSQSRTNLDLTDSLVLIDFTSPGIGYALSIPKINESVLYKTIDGGQTWIPLW
jgi:photosystem II stability/assembly factor-like uncharacterized protein